jgi:hypothetical protein
VDTKAQADDAAAARGSGEPAPEPPAAHAKAVGTLHAWLAKGKAGADDAATEREAVQAALEVLNSSEAADQLDRSLRVVVQGGAKAPGDKNPGQITSLEAAVRESKLSARSPLGLVFTRTLEESQRRQYEALGSHAQKEAFRVAWAAERLQKLKATYRREEASSVSSEARGQFVPLSVLVQLEGGFEGPCGADNVKAALRHYRKALALGAGWARWNTFTERPEVKHVRHTESDLHSVRHTKAVDYEPLNTVPALENGPPPEDQGTPREDGAADPEKKRRAQGEPHGAKPKAKAKAGRSDQPAGRKPPAPKEDLKKQLVEANKTRNKYLQATGGAQALVQKVQTEPAWRWCQATPFYEPLLQALDALQKQAYEDSFVRDFIREPKTPPTAAGLERVGHLEKAIEDLQKKQKKLQAVGATGTE